jgi:hypothetical protein
MNPSMLTPGPGRWRVNYDIASLAVFSTAMVLALWFGLH